MAVDMQDKKPIEIEKQEIVSLERKNDGLIVLLLARKDMMHAEDVEQPSAFDIQAQMGKAQAMAMQMQMDMMPMLKLQAANIWKITLTKDEYATLGKPSIGDKIKFTLS